MPSYNIPQRLDVSNATNVETEIITLLDNAEINELTCDFSNTEYISSAGLRIMLKMTKKLKSTGGKLILCKLQKQVLDVFKLAGFQSFMDIRD